MTGLREVVFNVEFALGIDVISAFILGSILFLIKVPNTEYSRRIAKTKNTIAACFSICAILFYTCFRHSGIENYDVFASMMMFVITSMSSAVLSFSLINLLDERYIENDTFFLNIGLVVILSIAFVRSFRMEKEWLRTVIHIVYVLVFVLQCISYIIAFRKRYKEGLHKLEQYYDEDEEQKLKWIHFCYVIMMLTQMFILVYRIFPTGFMKVYNVWYALFMLYFTANFISFLGSHKLTLDAFAYKTMTGINLDFKKKKKGQNGTGAEKHKAESSIDFRKLEKALEEWVEQKKFSEYDKSREDVAKELGTTKEFLHLYFSTHKGMDFKTWRTELRIAEAKRLLLDNKDLSTNLIGEIAGFSDRSNFHRQFVKFVGCSPKQWRDSKGRI
jgi:AraC-like DNA-binding protein/multisubunit Na+/H+ antiporter MnhG subunit